MKNSTVLTLILCSFILVGFNNNLWAQTTKKKLNKTEKGGIIGAASGAVVGGIIGGKKNNAALGAILGAVVGGTAGVIIGGKMDKKAKEIEDQLGKTAKVERVGEGIKVTFNNQLLFDFGKSNLKDENVQTLQTFATTLNANPDTDLLIVGHTDNVGSNRFNQVLSSKRAMAVSNLLESSGIGSNRIRVQGKGETQPAVGNGTDYNRSQNRRVEIAIYANKQMKADAKTEALQ
jgi:outer membrane protein OmpA-like peptidoglycan-associated protein